jgi:hypothetical protein
MWLILLVVYWVNAAMVVMSYQFVNACCSPWRGCWRHSAGEIVLTVAYPREFPSAVSPCTDEIGSCGPGSSVIAGCAVCAERAIVLSQCKPDMVLQSLPTLVLLRALWLCVRKWNRIRLNRRIPSAVVKVIQREGAGHAAGACYAVPLVGERVDHIHVHHGYFGSWIAMVAARLLGTGFSMMLHGSDLLLDATYLDVKLGAVHSARPSRNITGATLWTLSGWIRKSDRGATGSQISEQAMLPVPRLKNAELFTVLAVGRLHSVKDHAFLIRARTASVAECPLSA